MTAWHDFEGKCVKETDRAILIDREVDGQRGIFARKEDAMVWIPKSQLSPDSEVREEGDEGTVTVTTWIAEERGLL